MNLSDRLCEGSGQKWASISRLREKIESANRLKQKSYTLELKLEEDFKKKEEEEMEGKEHEVVQTMDELVNSVERSKTMLNSVYDLFEEE